MSEPHHFALCFDHEQSAETMALVLSRRAGLLSALTTLHALGTEANDAIDAVLELIELDEVGDQVFVPLARRKVDRRRNADGTWRWYGAYAVPSEFGGGTVLVRLDTSDEDRRRKFNRTEHLRPIPPADPDYRRLYPRRSDSESINRALDDSLWLGRAHSVGGRRQLVDLLGFAIAVNSVALYRARHANAPPGQVAA